MVKLNTKNILLITLIIGASFLCSIIVYAQTEHDGTSGSMPNQNPSTYDLDKASETNTQTAHDVATGPMPYQDTSTYGQDKASETEIIS